MAEREDFHSYLNMEDVTNADYTDFDINNLVEYHDFYVQSDRFLLADVFKSFRNKCLKIYELVFLLHQH